MASATSIMRVQPVLLADFDDVVGRHGLTFARYEALVLLAFSSAGELPMSKVGERLMVHPTSATNIVQRLEAQGLVSRSPNPRDGRGTLAAITDSGREVMEAATADLVQGGFGLSMLTPGERDHLFALLRKVRVAAGTSPSSPSVVQLLGRPRNSPDELRHPHGRQRCGPLAAALRRRPGRRSRPRCRLHHAVRETRPRCTARRRGT